MEETKTGGGKEFVYSMIWTIILLTASQVLTAALPSAKVIGVIFTIIVFCILGFFALTRYAAVYTYTLKNNKLRVNRKIGHRNKELEISLSAVKAISKNKPSYNVKHTRNMHTSVFSKKNLWYAVYESDGGFDMLVFEPSRKMADKIKSGAKGRAARHARKSERN